MSAAELLLNLGRAGIRLEADGDKLRYFPRSALSPELLGWMKAHKFELLALLRPAPDAASALPAPTSVAGTTLTKPVCRCGSTTWRDMPIHGGQSIRRDCSRCGRFLYFLVWYGKDALQNEN